MNTTQSVLCYLRAGPIMGHWTKLNCRGVGLRRYFISVNHQVCEVEHKGWLWVTSESGACSVSHSFLSHSPRDYTPAQHEEAVSLKDMFKAHTPAFFSLFHTHTTQLWMQQPTLHQSLMCHRHKTWMFWPNTFNRHDLSAKGTVPCPSSTQPLNVTVPQEGSDENPC